MHSSSPVDGACAEHPGRGRNAAYRRPVTDMREWLEDELRTAILKACDDDAELFRRGASERSLMFRIGRYLAPAVEGRCPGRLWVDCEYNRVADPAQAKVIKQVRLDGVPGRKRSVFPDLIVHDRSGSSPTHNILIVEAKKEPAGTRGVAFDLRKLEAYQSDLFYQHAVYLELGTPPRWRWMDRDQEAQDCAGTR
jgi:hypothetical protein